MLLGDIITGVYYNADDPYSENLKTSSATFVSQLALIVVALLGVSRRVKIGMVGYNASFTTLFSVLIFSIISRLDFGSVADVRFVSTLSWQTIAMIVVSTALIQLSAPTKGIMRIPLSSGPQRKAMVLILTAMFVSAAIIILLFEPVFSVENRSFLSVDMKAAILILVLFAILLSLFYVSENLNRQFKRERLISSELRKAMNANEVLLGELNHRVKNNLQNLDALIVLELSTLKDPMAHDVIRRLQARTQAISLFHSSILNRSSFRFVNLGDYFGRLAENIRVAAGLEQIDVRLSCVADDFDIDFDRALPLALIVNELVQNSIKHACQPGVGANIRLTVRRRGEDILVAVRDDGGPSETSPATPARESSHGVQIVDSLVRQLKGRIVRESSDAGFNVEILIPLANR